jgi:hypothetical protein
VFCLMRPMACVNRLWWLTQDAAAVGQLDSNAPAEPWGGLSSHHECRSILSRLLHVGTWCLSVCPVRSLLTWPGAAIAHAHPHM